MADVVSAIKSIPLDKIFIGAVGLFLTYAFVEPAVKGFVQNSFLRGALYVALGGILGYAIDGTLFKVVGTSIALYGGLVIISELFKAVGVVSTPVVA